MIMALGASDGLSEPNSADGTNAIGKHSGFVVFWLCATFFGRKDQPIERGSDSGFLGCIWKQITSELFDGEAVEGFVGVECGDDIITIGPDIARVVAVVSDGVGKAY